MERIDAINWMEQWAERWGVELEPLERLKPGGMRVGLVRSIKDGQKLEPDALQELVANAKQLTFEEFGKMEDAGGGVPTGDPAAATPPIDNMGGKLTTEPLRGFSVGENLDLFAGVDWVNLVGKGDEARAGMLATLQKRLGPGQAGLNGLHSYTSSWHFDSGCILTWSEGREDWLCTVNGRTFELVGQAHHLAFLVELQQHTDHCTRIDTRLDDYSRQIIDLGKVSEAIDAGNFIGPRVAGVIQEKKLLKRVMVGLGQTLFFGRRGKNGGGAYIRIYDKGLESKGRVCSNRFEVEWSKEKADLAWGKIITAARLGEAGFVQALGELCTGAIDFRERGEHQHLARMERLTWWANIVDRLGAVKLKVEKVTSTLNSSMQAMVKQYAKKLARACVVAEAKGHDLLVSLWGAVEREREGQELDDVELSPLEACFNPAGAFRLSAG